MAALSMPLVYLDNNATTRPCPEAVAAMLACLTDEAGGGGWGNPSSVHRFGQRARQAIDEARGKLATLVGCSEAELLLTGSGTEATNTALRSLVTTRSPRRRIVTSAVEHSATRELCQALEKEGGGGGAEVIEIPVDSLGRLDYDRLAEAVTPDTAFVTLLWANNETGVLTDVARVVEVCRRHRVPLHLDATQAVGKLPVNLAALGADFATFAPHKFHGPKGVGVLYVRRGARLRPWLVGGPQERGRRGGTENVAGVAGSGAAAEVALRHLPDFAPNGEVARRRDRLERELLRLVPEVSVNGDLSARLSNTTNLSFARLEAEAILLLLSEQGLCASAGAACASGSLEPSHVLKAMNLAPAIAHGAVRFSLTHTTTDEDITRALEIIPPAIARLRQVLPLG